MLTLMDGMHFFTGCLLIAALYTCSYLARFYIYLRRNNVPKWNRLQGVNAITVLAYICDRTVRESDVDIEGIKRKVRQGLAYMRLFLVILIINWGFVAGMSYIETQVEFLITVVEW